MGNAKKINFVTRTLNFTGLLWRIAIVPSVAFSFRTFSFWESEREGWNWNWRMKEEEKSHEERDIKEKRKMPTFIEKKKKNLSFTSRDLFNSAKPSSYLRCSSWNEAPTSSMFLSAYPLQWLMTNRLKRCHHFLTTNVSRTLPLFRSTTPWCNNCSGVSSLWWVHLWLITSISHFQNALFILQNHIKQIIFSGSKKILFLFYFHFVRLSVEPQRM